jgi:hypothetical protein
MIPLLELLNLYVHDRTDRALVYVDSVDLVNRRLDPCS